VEAYDFIERNADVPVYIERTITMSKYQTTLTILQERCEKNRNEAHSRLHRAKEALLTVVERSLLELHRTVETRSEPIMSELRTDLKRYMSDKSYTLEALQPPVLEFYSEWLWGTVHLYWCRQCWRTVYCSLRKQVLEKTDDEGYS